MSGLVPRQGGEVVLPAEVVRENVRSVISKMPDLISFDPTDEANESLMLRCAVDPGVERGKVNGWVGTVVQWHVGTQEVPDEKTGEVATLPSLCLISDSGELVRTYGWPAIRAWARLLQAAGAERCALGITVRVSKRPSSTAGRSYWIVLPA